MYCMKKLLGLLLAMAVAFPVSANVLNNVELKGEIQTIASDARHDATEVYGSGTNYRVLAGLSAELVEDVTANVLFQYNSAWDGATAGSNLDTYWNNVNLVEANVVLSNLFDRFELTVGRQFYGDENSAVMYFGPDHYIFNMNAAPSLDAAKLVYSDDFKAITLLAGRVEANAGLGNEYFDLYGADIRLNLTDALNLQVYGYDFVANADTMALGEEDHNGFYGAKLGYAAEVGVLSVEYARAHGGDRLIKESHDNPYMIKVDGSLNMEAFTPRATFMYSKGEVSPFGNYRPGLLVGHVRNIYEYSVDWDNNGLRLFNVGVDYTLDKWVFSLDGYSFQDRTASESATLEADLTAKYNHNEYVQLFAGIGYGKYGGNAKEALGASDNTIGQLGMLIKF